jgi:hypothetical protein
MSSPRGVRSPQGKNKLIAAFVFNPALFILALVLYPVPDIAIHGAPRSQNLTKKLSKYTTLLAI